MEKRGTFTISIDLEFAWGYCDIPLTETDRRDMGREREIVQRLLHLFSRYDVSATWAVVGHLLLAACARRDGRVHPEIPRPVTNKGGPDWFFQHPETTDDPLWYGRDVVTWIKAATPVQEIGSHSFCHLPYNPGTTTREVVAADLAEAKRLHQELDLPFSSFVFPQNVVGYRDLLAESGLLVYRGNTPRWYRTIPVVKRMMTLLVFLLAVGQPTVRAQRDKHGLVDVPDSMLLLGRSGIRRWVSPRNPVRMARRGLERAVARGEIFHLWFHPSNFQHETETQLGVLEAILAHAGRLRGEGKLEVLTMGDVQRRIAPSNQRPDGTHVVPETGETDDG